MTDSVSYSKTISILITLFISVFFCFTNLDESIRKSDESIHTRVVQEMAYTGGYFTPKFGGVLYYNKPPFKMWLSVPIVKLFNESNASYRYIDALSGVLISLLVWYITFLIIEAPFFSILSPIILLSSKTFLIGHGVRTAVQDGFLTLLITIILTIYLKYRLILRSDNEKLYLVIGALTGVAVLTKWIAGLLPLIIIAAFELILFFVFRDPKKKLPVPSIKKLLILSLATLIPPALYIVPQLFLHYAEILDSFYFNITDRLIVTGYHNINNTFIYFKNIFLDYRTGSPFLIILGVFMITWNTFKNHEMKMQYIFIILWGFLPIFLYTVPKSRLPWYILPAYPALAISQAIALYLICSLWQDKKKILLVPAFIAGVLLVYPQLKNNIIDILNPKAFAETDNAVTRILERGKEGYSIYFIKKDLNSIPDKELIRRDKFYLNKLQYNSQIVKDCSAVKSNTILVQLIVPGESGCIVSQRPVTEKTITFGKKREAGNVKLLIQKF